MSSAKHKLRLVGAIAALATLALAVSCKGFFTNPPITTITVDPPTPSINVGATVQMTATATYQDNTTGPLTGGTSCTGNTVCWSSSDTTVATVTTGGLVTGVSQGTATLSAASGAITGSTTATVDLANITNFVVCAGVFGATTACSSGTNALSSTVTAGTSANFIAEGSSNGTEYDLTTTATWTPNFTAPATGGVTCTNSGASPESCQVLADTPTGTYPFIVTYGTGDTATLNISVP